MILDTGEPLVYLFSHLKIHLALEKLQKCYQGVVFFNSYDTLATVTFIANRSKS